MSRKILELAREQQAEVGREFGDGDEWADEDEDDNVPESSRPRVRPDEESDLDSDDDFGADVSGGEEEAELEIDPEDHATLDALNAGAGGAEGPAEGGQTLADLIFAKMASQPVVEDEGPPDPKAGLNPKVVEVYTK